MAKTAALLGLIGAAGARAEDAGTNPLAQVIKMANELSAKVKADGDAEAKAYKEYFEWCDDVSKEKQYEIETTTSQKEKLTAKISELAANIETGESTIAELAEKISTNSADLKSATDIRKKESADFAASEKELIETVDVLGRAIGVLEKELGSASFAQVSKSASMKDALQALNIIVDAASFSVSDKKRLTALVQASEGSDDSDEDDLAGAPAAAAYESKSGGILDVLNDMQEKAETQLSELRKAEATAKGNYDLLKQGLTDQLANDNKELADAKSGKAADEEGKATAEGDLSVTVSDLKSATEALASTQSGCMTVASDHEASIASRAEELKVIAEAIKILKETTNGAASFLQVSSSAQKKAGADIVREVKALAKKHHSAALAQLASRMSAAVAFGGKSADPFVKIRGLIEDMIAKLEKEASEEATEKAYCDEEMKKTETKKGELEADVEKLSTGIDQASARSAELKEEVKDLQAELAAMAKEQAEADKVRQDDHEVYVKQKADLELALGGIRKALEVLSDYYAKSDSAASLLQDDDSKFNSFMQQPAPPVSHGKSGGAGGSIISILEVCESDTATELSKVETQESDEAEAYEKALQEFKVTKASKDQDVKFKTQEFTGLDKSVTEMSGDRDTVNTELSAVNEYYAKLQDRCVAKPESYEDRKKRREAEIEGLKSALTTLENEAGFLQRGGKRNGHRHMRGALAL